MTLEQDFETVQRESRMWGEAHAALDRIRTALVDHQRFLRESQAEVERLRRVVDEQTLRLREREAEVARWRAALETIQELAATESLRVFHTIASDALAGIKR